MDFIASLGCAAALVFGLLCLVKPAALKRQSRWDGAAILLLMPVMVGISLMANPKVSQPGETTQSVREAGIAVVVFFGLLAVSAFLIGLLVSAKRARVGGSAGPELDLEESLRLQREWVAAQKSKPAAPKIPRKGWRELWAEAKAKQEKADQERAARRAEVQAQRDAARARGAKTTPQFSVPAQQRPEPSAEAVDARTWEARRARLAKVAAPSGNAVVVARIAQPNALPASPEIEQVAKAVKGKSVPVPTPEWCRPKPAEVEELIELRGRGKSSGWAGFMHYTDANGDESARRIICRSISGYGRPETVTAFCCERKAHRTFRIDRIKELICLETGEVLDPAVHFDELWRNGALKVADKTLTDFARILVFMARCDGEFHPLELKEVETALARYGAEFSIEDKTIKTAIRNSGKIAPDDDDFVMGLSKISKHPNARRLSRLLLESVSNIAAADGRIHQQEAVWTAVVSDALKVMSAGK